MYAIERRQRKIRQTSNEEEKGGTTFMLHDCVINLRQVKHLQQHVKKKEEVAGQAGLVIDRLSFSSCRMDSSNPQTLQAMTSILRTCQVKKLEFGETSDFSYHEMAVLIASCSCAAVQISTTSSFWLAQHTNSITIANENLETMLQPMWGHANLRVLKWSNLDGCNADVISSLSRLLPRLPHLEQVILTTCNLESRGFQTLVQEGILPSPRLEKFVITEERFGSLDRAIALPAFVQLLQDTNLVHLELSGFYRFFVAEPSSLRSDSDLPRLSSMFGSSINTKLQHFALGNISFMNVNLARTLFSLLLKRFTSLKALHWNDCTTSPIQTESGLAKLLNANMTLQDFSMTSEGCEFSTQSGDTEWLEKWSQRNKTWGRVKVFVRQQIAQDNNGEEALWPRVLTQSDANSIHHLLLHKLVLPTRHFVP